ncbi:2',3'-cyclic-nucleotide 3'-phosphodiesterase [Cyathus striatus]|nr:2',3'-cyclic-nucleotide 3'-phosphodiesterase [Cyathus striatus]
MGVTLWIVPPDAVMQKLKNIMKLRGSDELHSETTYPDFTPHITLASIPQGVNITIPTLRASIPPQDHPLNVELSSVDIGSVYFRSNYIAVKLSPELTTLHQHVHAALGIDPRTPSYPHISLTYIADEEVEERKKYHKRLVDEGRIKQLGNGVELNCAPSPEAEDWISGFEAAEVWIAKCEGPVETWEIIEKIPLNVGSVPCK